MSANANVLTAACSSTLRPSLYPLPIRSRWSEGKRLAPLLQRGHHVGDGVERAEAAHHAIGAGGFNGALNRIGN